MTPTPILALPCMMGKTAKVVVRVSGRILAKTAIPAAINYAKIGVGA